MDGKSIDITDKEQKNFEKSFKWGKFYIALAYIRGIIALVFGFILGMKTEQLPSRLDSFLIGFWALSLAVLLTKRKKSGLFLVYASLFSVFLELLVSPPYYLTSLGEKIMGIVLGAIFCILNFIYFFKRRQMFLSMKYDKVILVIIVIFVALSIAGLFLE